MTVWQKISGLATAVSDAGGNLLEGLGHTLGIGGESEPQKDVAFTIAVVALGAKMASADGVASSRELDAFTEVFRTTPEESHNVERLFNLAKQDVAGYEAYADQIARLLGDDRKLLQHMLEGLMYIAAADETLHPREDAFLEDVARRFGFSHSEYRFFRARFVKDHDNPYDALRLTPEASDAEVKAQYRKLVRDNHPDRLIANGVAPEFIDLANRKLAAINTAYEAISRERGL